MCQQMKGEGWGMLGGGSVTVHKPSLTRRHYQSDQQQRPIVSPVLRIPIRDKLFRIPDQTHMMDNLKLFASCELRPAS